MIAPRHPFASATIAGHLARGMIGIAAMLLAIRVGAPGDGLHAAASLALGLVAIFALRGCPICWTTGLIAMLRERLRPRRPADAPRPGTVSP